MAKGILNEAERQSYLVILMQSNENFELEKKQIHLLINKAVDRFFGYKQALLDHNIDYDPSLIYICNNNSDFEDGYNTAEKSLKEHGDSVDAIFAITDVIAMGVLKYFNDHNIKVPKDIAVMSFSNWFMSLVSSPTLSTVEQRGFEMGKKATQLLLQEIDCKHKGIAVKPQKVVLQTQLAIRDSS